MITAVEWNINNDTLLGNRGCITRRATYPSQAAIRAITPTKNLSINRPANVVGQSSQMFVQSFLNSIRGNRYFHIVLHAFLSIQFVECFERNIIWPTFSWLFLLVGRLSVWSSHSTRSLIFLFLVISLRHLLASEEVTLSPIALTQTAPSSPTFL